MRAKCFSFYSQTVANLHFWCSNGIKLEFYQNLVWILLQIIKLIRSAFWFWNLKNFSEFLIQMLRRKLFGVINGKILFGVGQNWNSSSGLKFSSNSKSSSGSFLKSRLVSWRGVGIPVGIGVTVLGYIQFKRIRNRQLQIANEQVVRNLAGRLDFLLPNENFSILTVFWAKNVAEL